MVPGETLPHCVAGQITVHCTPLLEGSLVTVDVNSCVPFAMTVAVAGETVTEIAGGGGALDGALDELHPKPAKVRTTDNRICRTNTRFLEVIAGFPPHSRFDLPNSEPSCSPNPKSHLRPSDAAKMGLLVLLLSCLEVHDG